MTKIYFQTHGCSTNFSESEVMQGILTTSGFNIIKDKEEADIIVLNICTAKGEKTALRELRKLNEEHGDKKLIVAGCIPPELIPKIREITEDVSLISTHNIKKISEVVEEMIHDNLIDIVAKDEDEIKLNLPRIRKNSTVGIIPILSGCNSSCAYCSVKLIKGDLISYPVEEILKEVRNSINNDCKELWVTSQDNAAYGLENKHPSTLPALLNQILEPNREFKLRLGMMNPGNVLPILDDLINIYKNDKVFKFLHIPVQSGNDEVLKLMNRSYTTAQFKDIVNKFKEQIPHITIATDIIVGFPTETDEQFDDSLNLIKEIKPDVINISKFQPRPNTKALALPQLDINTIKDRSRMLTDIFHNISRMQNERYHNWEGPILIDEKGKDNTWVGRNFAYKPVIVKGDLKLGQTVNARINNITTFDLRAEIIRQTI
jgi:MiaB-like tRNA modifying enzyme